MKIVPEKKVERFVDEATLRSAIRSRQSYLRKEHNQEKKSRINFKYVEVDSFGKEMSEIFHYSSTPFHEHADAFFHICGDIDFVSLCKDERQGLVASLCLKYKYEKDVNDKRMLLKALAHLLEGTFLKDRKESAAKTYIVENVKVMFEHDIFKILSRSLIDSVKNLEKLYKSMSEKSASKLVGVSLNDISSHKATPDKSNVIFKKQSLNFNDGPRKNLNVIKDDLGLYSSMLCMLLVGVISGKCTGIRDSLKVFFMSDIYDDKIFLQFLLDCLVLFCNQSVSELPIKKLVILIRLSLLVMLGTCIEADANHDKFRHAVGLSIRQHRLNMPKKCENSNEVTNQPSKLRLDDFVEYMSNVYMNHFGIDIAEIKNYDKCAVFQLYTKYLPPILHQSIEMDKKRVYVPLSEIHIKQENDRLKYPITFKKTTLECLKPTEILYEKLISSLSKYVVAILKLFLSSIPHKTTASELPIYSELSFRSSSDGAISKQNDDSAFPASTVLYSMKKSVDKGRHQEILSKSLSTILLLLLKHFKSNNYYQFETLCYQMTSANFIQLACKFMGLNFQDLVVNKTSLDDYDFPWTLQEESLENTDKEISKVKVTKKGSFSYKTTFDRKNNWRILHTLTNILRIVQKITKHKPNRIKLLVHYKTSLSLRKIIKLKCTIVSYFSIKLLKSQVPYLGKIWCKGNWKIFSLIYFLTHMHIHDDWVNSTNKNTTISQDFKDVVNLGIKHPQEKLLKEHLDTYNQQYLNPTACDDFAYMSDFSTYNSQDSIDDSDFDDYLQNAFPVVAMDWVHDNIINNPIDWEDFKKSMGFDHYLCTE